MNLISSMHIQRILTIVLISLLSAGKSWADFSCSVNVIGVIPYNSGQVNVLHSGRGDWTMICSLTETYTSGLTVKPETCAMWTGILLQAKKNNTPVTFWFTGSGTCAAINTYASAPVPVYIGPMH
jgi:hypothetical protein